jgi:hypothetical protein
MANITTINSGNGQRIQKMLEYNLIKYKEEPSSSGKIIIDAIYAFEMEHAQLACKKLDRSLGFIYFSENYNHYEKSLAFFSDRMVDDILNFKENVEGLIHDSYKTFQDYKSDSPRAFLIDVISKYDKDLASFLKVNMAVIDSLDKYVEIIGINWESYEEDREECSKLISKLDKFYDEHSAVMSCPRTDAYIYLFKKNGMINDFKKYYVMEDTSEEEFNDIIEKSDIFANELSIKDIKLIAEMDKIIKENNNTKIKRLRF